MFVGIFITGNYLFIKRSVSVVSETTPTSPQSHPSARRGGASRWLCFCVPGEIEGLPLPTSVSSRNGWQRGNERNRDRDVAGAAPPGWSAGMPGVNFVGVKSLAEVEKEKARNTCDRMVGKQHTRFVVWFSAARPFHPWNLCRCIRNRISGSSEPWNTTLSQRDSPGLVSLLSQSS